MISVINTATASQGRERVEDRLTCCSVVCLRAQIDTKAKVFKTNEHEVDAVIPLSAGRGTAVPDPLPRCLFTWNYYTFTVERGGLETS